MRSGSLTQVTTGCWTADDRQRTRPLQKQLIIEHRVLYFCLAPDHVFTLDAKVHAVVTAAAEMKRLASLPGAACTNRRSHSTPCLLRPACAGASGARLRATR